MTKNGKLFDEPFEGKTINTPSMMCVEDCLDALKWAESIGGLPALLKRSAANLQAVEKWVEKTDWAEFLAETPETRSSTSICFKVVDPWFLAKETDAQLKIIKETEKTLEKEGVAFEVANHRDAPASYRIWGGATVETSDVEAVLEWIDWAFRSVKAQEQAKAA
jgi:phosphoserine aminotransferase